MVMLTSHRMPRASRTTIQGLLLIPCLLLLCLLAGGGQGMTDGQISELR